MHLLQLDLGNVLFLSIEFVHSFARTPPSLLSILTLIVALPRAGVILMDPCFLQNKKLFFFYNPHNKKLSSYILIPKTVIYYSLNLLFLN